MMSKGNDINVGSIEEDIEILNSLLTFKGKGLEYALEKKSIKAIENILQECTRQKQINEEHKKENVKLMKALNVVEKEKGEWIEDCNDLKKKVKELEEQVEYDKTHIYTPMTIQLNYIPKQKIKDKIEELRNDIKNQNCRFPYIVEHKIDVLQGLLQEEE